MPSMKVVELAVEATMPLAEDVAGAVGAKFSDFVAALMRPPASAPVNIEARLAYPATAASRSAAFEPSVLADAQSVTSGKATTLPLSGYLDKGDPGSQAYLPSRRFLREDRPAGETTPPSYEQDWKNRRGEISEFIADKINSQHLSSKEFYSAADAFPAPDKPYAKAFLDASAANATDRGVMQSLRSVMDQINQSYPDQSLRVHFLATSPSSSGNMLSYLARKTVNGEQPIFHTDRLDALIDPRYKNVPLVTFDDVTAMTTEQKGVLIEAQRYRPIIAVDLNGFDRSTNVTDFALGKEAVEAKLRPLVDAAKQADLTTAEVKAQASAIIQKPFNDAVADLASKLPPGGQGISVLRPQPVFAKDALAQPVAPGKIRTFFETEFKDPAARIMSAEILAEDAEIYSISGLMKEMPSLRDAVEQSAVRRGIDPKEDLFVVGTQLNTGFKGAASSEAFITHLYAKANGLSADRIVTVRQLDSMLNQGLLGSRRVIALDDATYTGEHALDILGQSKFEKFPDVAFANLSSMSDFAKKTWTKGFGVSGQRELITLRTNFSLDPQGDYFAAGRSEETRRLMSDITKPNSFHGLSSVQIYPHMTADTSAPWLAKLASRMLRVNSAKHSMQMEDPWKIK